MARRAKYPGPTVYAVAWRVSNDAQFQILPDSVTTVEDDAGSAAENAAERFGGQLQVVRGRMMVEGSRPPGGEWPTEAEPDKPKRARKPRKGAAPAPAAE